MTEQQPKDNSLEATADQAAAHESDSFRELAEAMPQLVWTARPDGTVDYYNRRWHEYQGITVAAGGGWQWAPALHPDDRQRTIDAWEHALRTGEIYEIEHRVYRADGELRWLLSRGVPVRDAGGRIVRWYGTATDIHAQKQAEAALRELNETLEAKVRARTRELEKINRELQLSLKNEEAALALFFTLFHASPVPTAITRLTDGRFIDVNEAHRRYFGLERDEVIGRTSLELNMWPDPGQRGQLVDELRREGRVRNMEILVVDAFGEIHTALISAEPIELDGEPCIIGSHVDITERVQAEQQVRRLATELSLAEERERQRIAKVLHDEVQQMLVALKVTLHMAKGLAETGSEMDATLAQGEAYLEELSAELRSLTAELSTSALTSGPLSDALTRLARTMAERYGLQVRVIMEAEADISDTDQRVIVMRLVRELLFNVVKHAGVNQARVVVREREGEVLICVEDEGSGFDAAGVMARAAEGAGFGLFSVRERLGLIGGRFELDSASGRGTQATIVIPTSS